MYNCVENKASSLGTLPLDAELVGRWIGLNVYVVNDPPFDREYFVCREKSIVVYVCLLRQTKSKTHLYSVEMIRVARKYQGFGIVPAFYEYLVLEQGVALKSGWAQSAGGMSIWRALAKRGRVILQGGPSRNRLSPVFFSDEEDDILCDSGALYGNANRIYATQPIN